MDPLRNPRTCSRWYWI